MAKNIDIRKFDDDIEMSSLLTQFKEKNTFNVPNDYFDVLESDIIDNTINKKNSRAISVKKVLYYAVAASVVIILSFVGVKFVSFFNDQSSIATMPVDSTNMSNQRNPKIKVYSPDSINSNIDRTKQKNQETQIVDLKSTPINNQSLSPITPIEENKNVHQYNGSEIIISSDNNKQVDLNNHNDLYHVDENQDVSIAVSYSESLNSLKSVARKNNALNNNFFLPADTCVYYSFTYSLDTALKSQVPNLVLKWNDREETFNYVIDRSGVVLLYVYIHDKLIGYDSMYVSIIEKPKPQLPGHIEICMHEDLNLNSELYNENYTYSWSHSDSRESEVSISGLKQGNYIVKLYVETCVDTTIQETFAVVNDCEIEIPNVITPNGDGYNDVFFIKGIEKYPGSSLLVVDRNGKTIFNSLDYKNDWGAEGIEAGTYFYSIVLNDERKTFKGGTLTIIKK